MTAPPAAGIARVLRRVVLVALLVFGTVPSGFELVETIARAVGHGALADGACDLGCDEHDCTPIQHRCACCGSPTATPPALATGVAAPAVIRPVSVLPAAVHRVGRGAPEPNHRPPIA